MSDADKKRLGLGVSPGVCIGRAVVLCADQAPELTEGGEPAVLVGHGFSPEEVLSMDQAHVCGFVTEAGGVTAYAGIVARSAGLPAVLGCAICDVVQTGDLLIVDGTSGEVVINPSSELIGQYTKRQAEYLSQHDRMSRSRYLPAETRDGLKIDVLANLDLVDGVPDAVISGAAGIGLLRSEFYYLTDDGAPSEEFLFTLYQHVLSSVTPLPVTIRTLDLSGTTQIQGVAHGVEENPVLGLKGIRFSLHHSSLFKTQLRALYRASAFGKLRVLLPMIHSLDELIMVKEIIAEVKQELEAEGLAMGDDVELGLMIEVPAAVFIVDSLAQELDFLSIGINDLIQYGLALDRLNAKVGSLYDPLHPAVLAMLDQVIKAGHGVGIDVGVCGEMAGEPQYVPLFLGLGVDWLSMPASAISGVKKMVRDSLADDCEPLAMTLLLQSSAKLSREQLQEFLQEYYADMDGGTV